MKAVNGNASYLETFYEVVSYMTYYPESEGVKEVQERYGTGGLYELAEELADQFEEDNKDREWDGEFFDEIEDFLNNELKQK